jgi:hypothetical protein
MRGRKSKGRKINHTKSHKEIKELLCDCCFIKNLSVFVTLLDMPAYGQAAAD